VIVPMYFLIGRWGHGNSAYAATKFFLFTMAGSALMPRGGALPSTGLSWPRPRASAPPRRAGCSSPSPSPSP
jgi:hypothetical protein